LGRLGWAHFLAGRTDTAATLLAQVRATLGREPEWRYRIGRVALELKEVRAGVEALVPNAVVARGSDKEVMDLLARAGRDAGRQGQIVNDVGKQIRLRELAERAMLAEWGATRGTFPARDGFLLGGVVVPAMRGGARPRSAVIVMAPEDSLPLYDSLAVSLARRGMAVMLLDPRGSGWSVGPSCPTPEAWAGDEHAMQKRVASDVRLALRALAQATRADTSRYLVVGAGTASAIAVEAAALDRRVAALLLVSPTPALVDEAEMLGRLERLQLPMFVQQAPEDPFSVNALSDALYQAGNRPASRVVDATSSGRGAAQFRNDPELVPRFVTWLGSALPSRPTPRATPRAQRR
jgi:dienelactone hydrolase